MSDAPSKPRPAPRKSRVGSTLKALLRTRISAGLITVLPIWVTIKVIQFVFRLLRDSSQWLLYGILQRDWTIGSFHWGKFTEAQLQVPAIQWGLEIFSVLLTAFILYAIGVFTANILGRRLIGMFETFVDRVPLAKTVYHASKQILQSFAGPTVETFQRVVLVPFPSHEVRSVGFVTSVSRDAHTGEPLCTVFLATTPNPTTGYMFVMRHADVIDLDWSVEEAVKVVMSGGILMPSSVPWLGALKAMPSGTETTRGLAAPPGSP